MTVNELIQQDVNILSNLRIPVAMIGEIGQPIGQVINDLTACLAAWRKDLQRKAQPEAGEKPENVIEMQAGDNE